MNLTGATIAGLLALAPFFAHGGVYKCVDPSTKAVNYSGTPCLTGDEQKVQITDNAIMDGHSAQRDIGERKIQDVYNAKAKAIGRIDEPGKARILAREAMISQNSTVIDSALNAMSGMDGNSSMKIRLSLEDCKRVLQEGGRCNPDNVPKPPAITTCIATGPGVSICRGRPQD